MTIKETYKGKVIKLQYYIDSMEYGNVDMISCSINDTHITNASFHKTMQEIEYIIKDLKLTIDELIELGFK